MKPLIVANWKMNPTTLKEAKWLFNSIVKEVKNIKNVEVVICPPFLYLLNLKPRSTSRARLRGRSKILNLKLGAQDCFWEDSGAFTGEISPLMLRNLGCRYVIIGHSERRKLGETNEMINKKIKTAIKAKLKPILCIGEKKKERKGRKTFQVLKKQLKEALINLPTSKLTNLILAYEPVWAIGTGNPCRPEDAKEVLLFLKKFLNPVRNIISNGVKKNPILYGGSVNSENALDYLKKAGFQGLLVGGASLNIPEFIKIVKNVAGA